MEEKTARQQGMTDVSSPGASSSGQASDPSKFSNSASPGGVGERSLDVTRNDDEAPDKVQKIMSICIGEGAADKKGGISTDAYADDLKTMAEEYRERDSAGE